ncbi:MAG TPA: hypothetical protein VKE96_17455 [Vicinamibacterales bacterium]|nr:hypothetical protein [Vicinamibacterales bacterium]
MIRHATTATVGPHVADAIAFLAARGLPGPDVAAELTPHTAAGDDRDLALIDLSDSLENVVALAHSLDADVDTYRLIATATLEALDTTHKQLQRVTAERDQLRDQLRALREDLLLRAGAA